MFVVQYRKIFYWITGILVGLSLFGVGYFGLNFGIEFTGGSILEVVYVQPEPEEGEESEGMASLVRPEISQIREAVQAQFPGAIVQGSEEKGVIIRTRSLDPQERGELLGVLSLDGEWQVEEERFNFIGPTIGQELRAKAWIAIALVVVAIILFIAYAFRHVSKPVSSWKYGVVAVLALLHDIIIPTGVYSLLGNTVGYEVDVLFVMALLAILGFSVNDTIVVFDRIRENLRINSEKKIKEEFEHTVGKSLTQTYARSINTSLTTLFVLLAIFFFGSESIHSFALVLAIGVLAGSYSSIFLASPLLVTLNSIKRKKA